MFAFISPVRAQQYDSKEKEGRFTLSLSGDGWFLWQDKQAEWKQDKLFLPEEITDLSRLPVNPPTEGWDRLQPQRAKAVHVPGTVEEYLTTSDYPRPEDGVGVSWWFRTLKLPADWKGKRFLIHFESVRLRAEVYLDGKLVAYDIIGESPFDADITDAVQPGKEQCLAVRVTNPGGNFHWQDFNEMYWGKYQIPPGRSFGGIIGRVRLDAVSPVYVSDIYMQNQPERTKVKAILTDIGTEELGHLEIVATIIYQLTCRLSIEEIKASGFDKYYIDHTLGIWPQAAGGIPFNACEFQSKGDPITDLFEDMAAEQKARSTYDNILRLCKDYPDVYEPIKFLRECEVAHFQRFGESLGIVREKMDTKNFYAFNSAFDTSAPCVEKCGK